MLQEIATFNPIASGMPAGDASPSVWPALARQIRESRHQSRHAPGFRQIRSWGGSAGRFAVRSGLAASLVCAAAWLWTVVHPTPRPPAAVVSREGPRRVVPVVEPTTSVAASVPARDAGDGGLTLSPASLDRLDHLASRGDQRSAALPDGKPARDLAVARPGVNPFEPPLPLHLDFDLDRGTLATPAARDTQRAY